MLILRHKSLILNGVLLSFSLSATAQGPNIKLDEADEFDLPVEKGAACQLVRTVDQRIPLARCMAIGTLDLRDPFDAAKTEDQVVHNGQPWKLGDILQGANAFSLVDHWGRITGPICLRPNFFGKGRADRIVILAHELIHILFNVQHDGMCILLSMNPCNVDELDARISSYASKSKKSRTKGSRQPAANHP
jgi:hypothetical protein